jgi:hypothetical protein
MEGIKMMKKFKVDNKVHDPQMEESQGLAFLKEKYPNATITPITDVEADELLAPPALSQQEINDQKNNQVEAELGGDNIRIIVETIVPMIQDGSITTAIPADIIAIAKETRKAEL